MANRSNAIEDDIIEINTLLDSNRDTINAKQIHIKKTLDFVKSTPPHELRKRMERLDIELGKTVKQNSVIMNELNELATEINAVIDVINENIQLSQNDIKLALDEAKTNINESQKMTGYTKKTGGRRRQRKTRKL